MLFEKRRKRKEEEKAKDLVIKAILTKGVSLSDEDLELVFGGAGDDRVEYTVNEKEIYVDIFGSNFLR